MRTGKGTEAKASLRVFGPFLMFSFRDVLFFFPQRIQHIPGRDKGPQRTQTEHHVVPRNKALACKADGEDAGATHKT